MESLKRTHDISHIKADPDKIFRLAYRVERWPEILPHYRWVKVLDAEEKERTVEMAARRTFIPVKWRSTQQIEPENRRIIYRHIGGLTRGMYVEWRIEPLVGGIVRVEIIHELRLDVPLVNTIIGKYIVSRVFIKHIAGRTLLHIKRAAEEEWTPQELEL